MKVRLVGLKRYDYENMLGLIQKDLKNYRYRLKQCQSNKTSEDDNIIAEQLCTVIDEIGSLEKYIKCTLGILNV